MTLSFPKYIFILVFSLMFQVVQALNVGSLRCEYRVDPLGVDKTTPRLSWEIHSNDQNVLQTAYQVLVADDLDLLVKNIGNVWDSKKRNSQQSIQVNYSGKPLLSAKKYYWKVKVWDNKGKVSEWSAAASWQMGLLTTADWLHASWIGYEKLPDDQKIIPAAHGNGEKSWGKRPDVLPLLRKEFDITKKIRSATAFISGLGQFELYINGHKAGDHFLDPGWTMYNKYALYVSFDVTKMLNTGTNAIGVMLGNGFYYIPGERYRKMTGAFGYPKMICRLLIQYEDGTQSSILSDNSWKADEGPVFFSSMYGGESYDANKEQTGWSNAVFDDSRWKKAVLVDAVPELQSQMAAPVKLFDALPTKHVNEIKPGIVVYDMGQNTAAIPLIEVKGRKGDTIKLIPGELLDTAGYVSQRSSGGPYFFTYVLKGDGIETWHPRFTYYGYRYIQVEHKSQDDHSTTPVEIVSIQSIPLHADYPNVGSFNCSNELFNKTERLIDWAIRSNMQSIFTDCPHRERLGWQEQLHLMGPSFHVSYDISSFGNKLMRDIKASQQTDGLIPSTIPEYTEMHFADGYFRDSPEWGSSGVIMPWNFYKWYGDTSLLRNYYPVMAKYMEYLDTKDSANLLMYGLSDWYDLGPNRPGFAQLTPMGLTATAIYFHDLQIMQKVAAMLHKQGDVVKYESKAMAVKAAFNKMFYQPAQHQYGTGSQTSNAMALYMQLNEPPDKQAILQNMEQELGDNDYRLTAGDIGYRYLLRVLENNGKDSLIYKMNNRYDVPGYGYQLAKGATALTESWNASPIVSNNHFMLGHILEWFYSGLAGIRQQEEGVAYNKILIAPAFDADVNKVDASFNSPYGVIKSNWIKNKSEIVLKVSIPVNTSAKLSLPSKQGAKYLINKVPVAFNNKQLDNKILYQLGSGDYEIKIINGL